MPAATARRCGSRSVARSAAFSITSDPSSASCSTSWRSSSVQCRGPRVSLQITMPSARSADSSGKATYERSRSSATSSAGISWLCVASSTKTGSRWRVRRRQSRNSLRRRPDQALARDRLELVRGVDRHVGDPVVLAGEEDARVLGVERVAGHLAQASRPPPRRTWPGIPPRAGAGSRSRPEDWSFAPPSRAPAPRCRRAAPRRRPADDRRTP